MKKNIKKTKKNLKCSHLCAKIYNVKVDSYDFIIKESVPKC